MLIFILVPFWKKNLSRIVSPYHCDTGIEVIINSEEREQISKWLIELHFPLFVNVLNSHFSKSKNQIFNESSWSKMRTMHRWIATTTQPCLRTASPLLSFHSSSTVSSLTISSFSPSHLSHHQQFDRTPILWVPPSARSWFKQVSLSRLTFLRS